jgi:hypothetical protein
MDRCEYEHCHYEGPSTSYEASAARFHCNRYSARSACEHCGGVIRHEPWCITLNAEVSYADQIVMDSTALSIGDSLILHSLGAAWA